MLMVDQRTSHESENMIKGSLIELKAAMLLKVALLGY